MRISEIKKIVDGTADPAYVLDPQGMICAWNAAAAELFAMDSSDTLGRSCSDVVRGVDECGMSCNENCSILHCARNHEPVRSYDIQVTAAGRQIWCNASVIILKSDASDGPYTLHVLRQSDVQKRLELTMRDFVASSAGASVSDASRVLAAGSSPTANVDLTKRETEILRLLSLGMTTNGIAEDLFISPTTARNHIQKILKKLSAHTRLEAVRRAERAGLI